MKLARLWKSDQIRYPAAFLYPYRKTEERRYTLICHVEKETFGMVELCYDWGIRQTVVMKNIPIIHAKEGVQASMIQHVSLAKELDNNFIVRLLDARVRIDGECVDLIFEHMDSDLRMFIRMNPPMSPYLIRRFLCQILDCIAYVHSLQLCHGDLKPDCVMVDSKSKSIKVADAELFRPISVLPPYERQTVENKRYTAPEILLWDPDVSTPADMWAVGCMLAEMVTGKPLFRGNCAEDVLHSIFCIRGVPNELTWPGVSSLPNFNATLYNPDFSQNLTDLVPGLQPNGIDLLSKMLCLDPAERITAKAALAHPFFDR